MVDLHDYVDCIRSIPIPDSIGLDIGVFKDIVGKVLRSNVSVDDLFRMLEDALFIRDDEGKIGYKELRDYAYFLAKAVLMCKQYAMRYDKCRELEKQNAPPDEIEICYEVADKTRKPLFILLGAGAW